VKPAAIALACLLTACSRETSGRSAVTAAHLSDPASSSDGARIYITNCSSCHQLDGRGVPGAFPALAANPAVTGDPRAVIAIVKFGLRTRGRPNRDAMAVMPPWQGLLSEDDIAAVVTYIRFAWHNSASPVTPREVKAVAAR
jgi:mono/diheme cytochrome c family protein